MLLWWVWPGLNTIQVGRVLWILLLCVFVDGGETVYDDYDYVMDKVYYQPGSEDYTVGWVLYNDNYWGNPTLTISEKTPHTQAGTPGYLQAQWYRYQHRTATITSMQDTNMLIETDIHKKDIKEKIRDLQKNSRIQEFFQTPGHPH